MAKQDEAPIDYRNRREERDSLGPVKVPENALWGAQTQRAMDNFFIGGAPLPATFIRSLAAVKGAAASVNAELKLLDEGIAETLVEAAEKVMQGDYAQHFPVDVYQTGSGTSSNMNMNEVLARLASQKLGREVHPNDHVNLGQSSNDVIPTALQHAVCTLTVEELLPALEELEQTLLSRGEAFSGIVKTGRTHLMDAMPLRLDQEFGAWASDIASARLGVEWSLKRLRILPIGGTAVGTGVNTHGEFGPAVARYLSKDARQTFQAQDGFCNLGSQDAAVSMSGQLNVVATALLKLCNDLRWMNSGPHSGLRELSLPALQPGSSIMPGKVNPVIPEAVAMACIQVGGLHTAITTAGQSGNFQLNVMLPLIASNLLEAVTLLARGASSMSQKAIPDITVNADHLREQLALNPILITALNKHIGYAQGAAIVKEVEESQRSVLEVALEKTDLSRTQLEALLDPLKLTERGIPGDDGAN
ncbi:class II fumarate hydratase [Congregibacter litoralis]|uniref:fumarate hydratase n=1 Tax=Congregibacter litoralis KT71 TaxID=314285 RepID=A4ACE8_9GAMM|nr:class II fumarate hydratase [Congregibacter litoralis]EAQ96376.1 fumarase, class II [Congregibacter litoralis KT71]